ncbi:MAG: carbohydrate porin, partial [Candidatus Orphnella occulta]|nr:carbohydrate porin [Candidatus Orphnella occulta]
MRTKGLLGGIALVIFLLTSACGLAFSTETVSNDDLIKELKAMKKIIAKQEERIAQLENQVNQETQENDRGRNAQGSAESSVSGQQEKIDNKLKGLKKEDISKRMKSEIGLLEGIPGGLNIGAGMTFVGQGTQNANNASTTTDSEDSGFDGSYSIDVEIEKEFDVYGMVFVHMEAGQGDAIEGALSVFSNVNRDAGETQAHVDVTEAWYEQYLFNNQLTITGGKIDATGYIDTNEYANDECTQFLGHIFRNSAVIDWPDDNAFGGRAYVAPEQIDFIDIEAVCMGENGDWKNLFNKPFVATQLNFMPAKAFDYDEESWAGNYRAYLWYNGALHSKIKNENETEKGNIG